MFQVAKVSSFSFLFHEDSSYFLSGNSFSLSLMRLLISILSSLRIDQNYRNKTSRSSRSRSTYEHRY